MLELIEVSRRYGDVVALEGLSLRVPKARMVGFVGPNGAGKTTAMRIVLGLQEPEAGEVRWEGRPLDVDVRRRIGYMPEERGLYPKMRALEQLTYLARLSGLDAGAALSSANLWVERFGLQERANDRVETLSLGNQQRVQLAVALVHNPDLLVLDEPFSGLDPVGVDLMSDVLKDEVASGAAVMFSSHQLELVERICDDVAIINNGRLVASGTVDGLRSTGERLIRSRGAKVGYGGCSHSRSHGAGQDCGLGRGAARRLHRGRASA
ncbi:MAG: ATP-binding cassette domain-containing protein [Actinomycetota bacterium]|nr:ATP-binding cassette domain-containing protein [Actinomycetota bacterium]